MGNHVKLDAKLLTIEPFIDPIGSLFGKTDAWRERTDDKSEDKQFLRIRNSEKVGAIPFR